MRPHQAFLVGAIGFFLLGLPWLISTPLMGAPDEPAHTIRAAAIVRGDAFGLQQEIGAHRGVRITGYHYRVYLPESWASLPLVSSCYAGNPERLPDCARPVREGTQTLPVATAAGRYPPPYYAGVGLPSLVVEPVPGVYLMRALSLLLAASMVGVSASALAMTRARPLAFGTLAVALTPMTPFLGASVNPNGVEITAAIATWVTGLQLFRTDVLDRRLVPLLVAAAGTFALARPTSPLFLATVVIAVLAARGRRDRLVELLRDPTARRWLLALVGMVVIGVVWTTASGALQSFGGVGRPDLTRGEILDESWDYTSRRIHQMVAWFGWLDSPGPLSLLHGWEVVTVLLAAGALVLGTWRVRVVLLLTVAGILVLPLAAEVLSAQRIGFAWQGRYTLPVAVGLPLLAGDTLEQRVTRGQRPVTMALLVLWVIGHSLGHFAALRRLLDGYPAPLLRFLSDPATSWRPPLGIVPTLVCGAVAALVCAAGLGWVATVTQDRPLDRSRS